VEDEVLRRLWGSETNKEKAAELVEQIKKGEITPVKAAYDFLSTEISR
jgi:hypothetical protein